MAVKIKEIKDKTWWIRKARAKPLTYSSPIGGLSKSPDSTESVSVYSYAFHRWQNPEVIFAEKHAHSRFLFITCFYSTGARKEGWLDGYNDGSFFSDYTLAESKAEAIAHLL